MLLKSKATYHIIIPLLFCVFQIAGINVYAQKPENDKRNVPKARQHRMRDENKTVKDSLFTDDSPGIGLLEMPVDTTKLMAKRDSADMRTKERKLWIPNSARATWLAAIIPGAGQIYNRKYWKLPIIYGGFVACTYALNWNNQMYKDYSQAYLDVMDNNPNTNSYLEFFRPGTSFDEEQLKSIFKRQKDFYRRNRDLSIFVFIGVYIISIIDAYVDAELSDFDISKDLSFRIEPALINDNCKRGKNSIGLQCSIKF